MLPTLMSVASWHCLAVKYEIVTYSRHPGASRERQSPLRARTVRGLFVRQGKVLGASSGSLYSESTTLTSTSQLCHKLRHSCQLTLTIINSDADANSHSCISLHYKFKYQIVTHILFVSRPELECETWWQFRRATLH